MTPTTRPPTVTNATHGTTPEPPSEQEHRRTKNQNQSHIKSQRNQPEITSRTKIQSSTHLGITISWFGPSAGAAGPACTGGVRC